MFFTAEEWKLRNRKVKVATFVIKFGTKTNTCIKLNVHAKCTT